MLGGLGLIASRFGLSAIPAYLLAGLLLGPNEPKVVTLISPSEVTDFVAEVGLIFLLFFLGLEFTLTRLSRSRRHVVFGGLFDLVANAGLGLLVGIAAFGFSFAALILAAAIYVSSSAIAVKGLIDFRRLADDETDLVLAILIAEDIAIALVLGFAAGGGGAAAATLAIVAKAIGFIAISLALSKWLSGPIDRVLDWLPREFFLLAVFGFLVGMAAVADSLGLSEAIGALMALAVPATVIGKIATGHVAGRVGGFSARQSFNAGIALIAHGEFTIILAQVASANDELLPDQQETLVAFAGLYVLLTATVGVVLMKESKVLGRRLFRVPTLAEGG